MQVGGSDDIETHTQMFFFYKKSINHFFFILMHRTCSLFVFNITTSNYNRLSFYIHCFQSQNSYTIVSLFSLLFLKKKIFISCSPLSRASSIIHLVLMNAMTGQIDLSPCKILNKWGYYEFSCFVYLPISQ